MPWGSEVWAVCEQEPRGALGLPPGAAWRRLALHVHPHAQTAARRPGREGRVMIAPQPLSTHHPHPVCVKTKTTHLMILSQP